MEKKSGQLVLRTEEERPFCSCFILTRTSRLNDLYPVSKLVFSPLPSPFFSSSLTERIFLIKRVAINDFSHFLSNWIKLFIYSLNFPFHLTYDSCEYT